MNYENMSNEELLKRYQRDGTIGHELKARLRRCLDMDDCECDRLRAELSQLKASYMAHLKNAHEADALRAELAAEREMSKKDVLILRQSQACVEGWIEEPLSTYSLLAMENLLGVLQIHLAQTA